MFVRRSIRVIFAVLLLMLSTSAVAVAGSKRAPAPATPFTLPASVCGFPIHIAIPVNNEYTITHTDRAGNVTRIQIVGALVVRLTNTTTGRSITLNSSGPATLIPQSDGSLLLYGHGLGTPFFLPGQLAGSLSGAFWYVRGLFVERINPDGTVDILRQQGRRQDICAMLA